MAEHFNGLTPAQLERLAYLNEELHEVGQIIGKIIRHGYASYDPTNPKQGGEYITTNREMLATELGDVMRAVSMLAKANDLDMSAIVLQEAKGPPSKYMHHQSNG